MMVTVEWSFPILTLSCEPFLILFQLRRAALVFTCHPAEVNPPQSCNICNKITNIELARVRSRGGLKWTAVFHLGFTQTLEDIKKDTAALAHAVCLYLDSCVALCKRSKTCMPLLENMPGTCAPLAAFLDWVLVLAAAGCWRQGDICQPHTPAWAHGV